MEMEFYRVRSVRDLIITIILIVCGCLLLCIPSSASINLLGFFLIFTGFILAFVLRTGYKDSKNGETYLKIEKYFAQSQKSEIVATIEKNPSKLNLCHENKGNGIRLDIYYSAKNGKAYVQLFEYIPYSYEACTDIHEYDLHTMQKFLAK